MQGAEEKQAAGMKACPEHRDDLDRLRAEYARREARLKGSDIYSPFNQAQLFMKQTRQRVALSLLMRYGFSHLDGCKILEVGCGHGGVLLECLSYGADPSRLCGIDIRFSALEGARRHLPHLQLTCSDGRDLPFRDGTFGLVLQYTAFSSVLDSGIKIRMASEMLRVLQKPDGLILWYDFWLNPTNSQTAGIRRAEICRLFPGCGFEFHRITLAPPIARRLVPISWMAASLLEKLRFLNSHYLVAIRPRNRGGSAWGH